MRHSRRRIASGSVCDEEPTERTQRKVPLAKVHSKFQSPDTVEVEAVEPKELMTVLRTPRKLIPVARVHSKFQSPDSVEVEAVELQGPMSILPLPHANSIRVVESREQSAAEVKKRTAADDEREQPEHTREPRPCKTFEAESLETNLSMYPYMEELKAFDLMNITITIYGITGILCEEKPTKKSKRRSSVKPSKSKEEAPKSKNNEASSENNFVIPTTVAASIKRNAISSQTVIETFYPSKPLKIETTPGLATNLCGIWQTPTFVGLEGIEEIPDPQSSFQILRMMMKKPYSKNHVLVQNYIHEQVQIGINLCRGGELMRLGVATLIITGEEEGQVMMHVPTRPVSNPGIQCKKHTSRNMKKEVRRNKFSFSNDDKIFRLDENASLYLGVQVNPQRDVEAAERFEEDIEATDSQLLRAAHAAKEKMMHLKMQQEAQKSDWTESQSSFKSSEGQECTSTTSTARSRKGIRRDSKKSHSSKQATTSTEVGMPSSFVPESTLSSMFCGAIPILSGLPRTTTAATGASRSDAETKSNNCGPSSEGQDTGNANQRSSLPPISEVLNVEYGPTYAKSFFSAVTYSYTNTEVTNVTDVDPDVSQSLGQSTLHRPYF